MKEIFREVEVGHVAVSISRNITSTKLVLIRYIKIKFMEHYLQNKI